MTIDSDYHARQQALDIHQSFIVQAPAGSGKTELLTQRYLALLAQAANHPEEIIAITFTRKAAHEMHERIYHALMAASEAKPIKAHQQQTWKLAQQVLSQSRKKQWNLLANPNRLRILTIDALCNQLCAQIPLLSKLGAAPKITDQAMPLYQQVAQHLLSELHDDEDLNRAIDTLLLHLDNRTDQFTHLLAVMLNKRAQWLPYIIRHCADPAGLKMMLENALHQVGAETLLRAHGLFDQALEKELCALLDFATENLSKTNPKHLLMHCRGLTQLPCPTPDQLTLWQALCDLFLTRAGTFRKLINKNNGFPTGNGAHKQFKRRWKTFMARLHALPNAETSLQAVLTCPPPHYQTSQWRVLEALLIVLPNLVSHLTLEFQRRSCIDFVELNLAAQRALGSEDEPTDLALCLDYKIQHLLVDEFQDTSIAQFELFHQLTQGWQVGDKRTLFFVGDPMQSIYRFRDANVGLFLQVQLHGMPDKQIKALTLSRNFRASETLVAWHNQQFKTIFPITPNLIQGAVPYALAQATQPSFPKAIDYVAFGKEDKVSEAQKIVEIIQTCREQNSTVSIAILVRSRFQLEFILPVLRQHKIPLQALAIEHLVHDETMVDLLTLTKALLHRTDRLSWLALLRSPLCGLTLADLHIIANANTTKTLWQTLTMTETLTGLTADAKYRIQYLVNVLNFSFADYGRQPLAQWLKGSWHALGGDRILQNAHSGAFFELVEKLDNSASGFSITQLEQQLKELYATTDTTPNAIQVMTIHKAKGLEFDHVILPGLERKTPNEEHQLLMWQEIPDKDNDYHLLLAPIKSNSQTHEPIYSYLRQLNQIKLTNETARLLYVATTRAKKSLHLLAHLNVDEAGEIKEPLVGSFLNLLWPSCGTYFLDNLQLTPRLPENEIIKPSSKLKRLPIDNFKNFPRYEISKPATHHSCLVNHQQRLTGIFIHEILARIATEGLEQWNAETITNATTTWQSRLQELGISNQALAEALKTVQMAISNALQDPRGRWILSAQLEAANEYALTAITEKGFQEFIIDRTFIEKGVRWIIDYKTAQPAADQTPTDFLQMQYTQYEKQLINYAHVMQKLDQRPIKLALYFPLCELWHEWKYTDHNVAKHAL